MIHREPGLPSRRSVVALGALLALPWGCTTALPGVRSVNLDAIGPDQLLLLGRIRLTSLNLDLTGDAFIRTNASTDEVLLPPAGEVAWVLPRISADVRLAQVSSSSGLLTLGNQAPVLAPQAVRTAINYFGTIKITLNHGLNDNRESQVTRQLGLEIVDDQGPAMAAFVAQNPSLAGRMYYHVLRGTVLQAPRPTG